MTRRTNSSTALYSRARAAADDGGGHGQRADPVDLLAIESQRGLAGEQDVKGGLGLQERFNGIGTSRCQVFAIVDKQQGCCALGR